ncbi:MAG TPA: hypothetical protein VI643_04105 [Planctomycetota bacterium]|nr:hypothetical protein [Planctomycetota bacterium]
MRLLRLALVGIVAATPLFADVVVTTKGKRFEGRITQETETGLTIQVYTGESVTISKPDIKSVKKGPSRFDEYDEKTVKEKPQTADDHVKLGKWCKSKGLEGLAKLHFERALGLDAENEEAKRGLGMRKVGEKWLSAEEAEKLEAAKRAAENAYAIEIKLAVFDDISKERLQQMADLFAGFSDDLWFATEGNAYIKSIVATDKSRDGTVWVMSGDVEKEFIEGGGRTKGGHMEVAGKCSVYTFVHEGGHLFFGLPDEYKSMGGGCPSCLMVGGNMEGFGPGKWKFCTEATHTGPGGPCWPKIKARFPKFTFPNPNAPKEPPFETKVSISNQGN